MSTDATQQIEGRAKLRRILSVWQEYTKESLKEELKIEEKTLYDAVKKLLKSGVQPDWKVELAGKSPLQLAAERNDLDLVSLLLSYGAKDNESNPPASEMTKLHQIRKLIANSGEFKDNCRSCKNSFGYLQNRAKYCRLCELSFCSDCLQTHPKEEGSLFCSNCIDVVDFVVSPKLNECWMCRKDFSKFSLWKYQCRGLCCQYFCYECLNKDPLFLCSWCSSQSRNRIRQPSSLSEFPPFFGFFQQDGVWSYHREWHNQS
mmetsp:Transcript_36883/g.50829  ORF Transcript_36883/g.50829 Transcript_36883/m.50829 type:complete len:260 (-) Transcript_36883:113-892(-)